jgi:transposase
VTRRFDLTDAQWAVLEPLLPTPSKLGRPSKWSRRQLIDGIRWRVRVGAPWRDVPDCYGHWRSVYGLYRLWQRDGTWARVLTGLQGRADALGLIGWDVSVDSTIVRAHQHAAGARRHSGVQVEPPAGVGGIEPDDHALGRSRGGLTTKLHLACEQGRKVLARVYLNGYVPNLQQPGQVVGFLTRHLGQPIPSPALMDQIGQRFRRAVDRSRAGSSAARGRAPLTPGRSAEGAARDWAGTTGYFPDGVGSWRTGRTSDGRAPDRPAGTEEDWRRPA